MNVVKKWRKNRWLQQRQHLLEWLPKVNFEGLYPSPTHCQITQSEADRSTVVLCSHDQPLVEITHFHEPGTCRLEMLLALLNLSESRVSFTDNLIMALFLADEMNRGHALGSVILRTCTGGILNLCWVQPLPEDCIRTEAIFIETLTLIRDYLKEVMIPRLEQLVLQFAELLKRESEFNVESGNEDSDDDGEDSDN